MNGVTPAIKKGTEVTVTVQGSEKANHFLFLKPLYGKDLFLPLKK